MAHHVLAILLIPDELVASGCLLKVLGDSVVSRLIRQLAKSGADGLAIVSDVNSHHLEEEISRALKHNLEMEMLSADELRSTSWEKIVFVQANLVSDSETIKRLMSAPEGFVLTSVADTIGEPDRPDVTDAGPFLFASLEGRSAIASEVLDKASGSRDVIKIIVNAGLKRISPQELSGYSAMVKRQLEPFLQLTGPRTSVEDIERALVRRVQKGKHLTSLMNKPFEDFLSLRAARFGATPNHMTALSNLLAYSAVVLMLLNQVALSVLLMLITCIVDGLDGKIARLRSMESDFGTLEHSLDFLYEQAWYGSYFWHLFTSLNEAHWLALGMYALIVDAFVRHVYNQFRITTSVALTDSSPVARVVAKFDGRRNIYVIYVLIEILSNVLALGLVLMALHASLTALIYFMLAWRYLVGREVELPSLVSPRS